MYLFMSRSLFLKNEHSGATYDEFLSVFQLSIFGWAQFQGILRFPSTSGCVVEVVTMGFIWDVKKDYKTEIQ